MRPLPSSTSGITKSAQNVVIDFSDFQQKEAMSGVFSHSALVEWVRSFPRTRSMHIYLPSDRRFGSARKLQTTLQSLGCTVTLRFPALMHGQTPAVSVS